MMHERRKLLDLTRACEQWMKDVRPIVAGTKAHGAGPLHAQGIYLCSELAAVNIEDEVRRIEAYVDDQHSGSYPWARQLRFHKRIKLAFRVVFNSCMTELRYAHILIDVHERKLYKQDSV